MRKFFKWVMVFFLAYFMVGLPLVYFQLIEGLPIGYEPGGFIKIKFKKKEPDRLSADGPYLIKQGGIVTEYSVRKQDSVYESFSTQHQQLTDSLLFTAVVEEGNRLTSFNFSMHPIMATPVVYPKADKIITISDIEGNFYAFEAFLKGTGVVDKDYNWSFGNGHLVLLGDFFDRGLHVTEVLWLVYKLEAEAERAGGKVHFINGNHELMNLSGDLRYVRNKYEQTSEMLGLEYSDLYGTKSVMGEWLRSKNVVEKIGDILFVHGGLSTELVEQGLNLEEINSLAKQHYGQHTDSIDNQTVRFLFGEDGPLWYRDMAQNEMEEAAVEQVLAAFGGSRIVLGHTLVDEILKLYGGSVVAIDLHHPTAKEEGTVKGLLIERGTFYEIDQHGQRRKL